MEGEVKISVSLLASLAGVACGFPGSACWIYGIGWDKARCWGEECCRGCCDPLCDPLEVYRREGRLQVCCRSRVEAEGLDSEEQRER